MDNKKIRIVTVLILVSVLLFCSVYILLESCHDCEGDGCRICAAIASCVESLRAVGRLTAAVFCVLLVYACLREYIFILTRIPYSSPISLKVKITD